MNGANEFERFEGSGESGIEMDPQLADGVGKACLECYMLRRVRKDYIHDREMIRAEIERRESKRMARFVAMQTTREAEIDAGDDSFWWPNGASPSVALEDIKGGPRVVVSGRGGLSLFDYHDLPDRDRWLLATRTALIWSSGVSLLATLVAMPVILGHRPDVGMSLVAVIVSLLACIAVSLGLGSMLRRRVQAHIDSGEFLPRYQFEAYIDRCDAYKCDFGVEHLGSRDEVEYTRLLRGLAEDLNLALDHPDIELRVLDCINRFKFDRKFNQGSHVESGGSATEQRVTLEGLMALASLVSPRKE